MNRRIAVLVDRDHQIGHSYFMKLKTLDDLQFEWAYKIWPLIQEYFYGIDDKLKHLLSSEFNLDEDAKGDLYNASVPSKGKEGDTQQRRGFADALKKLAGAG